MGIPSRLRRFRGVRDAGGLADVGDVAVATGWVRGGVYPGARLGLHSAGKGGGWAGLLTWRSFVRAPVSRRCRWGAARHPLQANLCVQVVSASDEGEGRTLGGVLLTCVGFVGVRAFALVCSRLSNAGDVAPRTCPVWYQHARRGGRAAGTYLGRQRRCGQAFVVGGGDR